jgi:hypothetical protein
MSLWDDFTYAKQVCLNVQNDDLREQIQASQ